MRLHDVVVEPGKVEKLATDQVEQGGESLSKVEVLDTALVLDNKQRSKPTKRRRKQEKKEVKVSQDDLKRAEERANGPVGKIWLIQGVSEMPGS